MTKLIQKTISMSCHPKFLNEVRNLMTETLAGVNASAHDKELLVLAVDEAVSSVVRYGRFKGYQNEITLTLDIDEVRFKATLVDSLNVFDWATGLTGRARAEHLDKERSFTLGLTLIRQIMDEVTYIYKKGFQNELELIRFL